MASADAGRTTSLRPILITSSRGSGVTTESAGRSERKRRIQSTVPPATYTNAVRPAKKATICESVTSRSDSFRRAGVECGRIPASKLMALSFAAVGSAPVGRNSRRNRTRRCLTSATAAACAFRGRRPRNRRPHLRRRAAALSKLLDRARGSPTQPRSGSSTRPPANAAVVKEMGWDEMQALFAATYVDEIADAERWRADTPREARLALRDGAAGAAARSRRTPARLTLSSTTVASTFVST